MKYKKLVGMLLLVFMVPLIFTGCFFDIFNPNSGGDNDDDYPKIEVVTIFKTEYKVGESLDVSGGVLKYFESSDEFELINITSDMISYFDTTTAGTKTLKLSYNGVFIYISYIVNALPDIDTTAIYYTSTYLITDDFGFSTVYRDYFKFKRHNDNSVSYCMISSEKSMAQISDNDFDSADWFGLNHSVVDGFNIYTSSKRPIDGVTSIIHEFTPQEDGRISLYKANYTNGSFSGASWGKYLYKD